MISNSTIKICYRKSYNSALSLYLCISYLYKKQTIQHMETSTQKLMCSAALGGRGGGVRIGETVGDTGEDKKGKDARFRK